jgi:hypothetical protein
MRKVSRTTLVGVVTLGTALVAIAACSSLSGLSNGGANADAGDATASQPDAAPDTQVTQQDGATGDTGPIQPDAAMPPDSTPGCTSSPCVLATGLNHPFAMTSNETNVYWVEVGTDIGTADGAVKGCPVAGCGAGPTVLASALINPRGLAIDGSNVYFGTAGFGASSGGIWSCPLAGCGNPTLLASAQTPWGMAVDATYLYWVDNNDSSVHRTPKAGGADLLLYDGGGPTIILPTGCVVDSAFVYLTDSNEDVARVPVAGGPLLVMTTGSFGGSCPITLDQNDLYYGPAQTSVLLKASKTATDAGAPIAIMIPQPLGVAMDPDGGVVYWANFGSGVVNDGTIGKVNVDGTNQINVATSLVAPYAVTVTSTNVFWLSSGTLTGGGNTAPGTGALMRGSK